MPRITWSSLWKVFARKAMVMNVEKPLLVLLWRVSFLISMAQTPAGLKMYSTCHNGCECHGTAYLDKQGRARNVSLRIKPASMHKCQSHWAEAPCLLSSLRSCCHPLCPLGSLCSARALPPENHTAADRWRLTHCHSLCPSCQQISVSTKDSASAASKSSCTCESHLSHQEQLVFSQGKSKSHQHCKANPEGHLKHQFACVPSKVSQVLTLWRSV